MAEIKILVCDVCGQELTDGTVLTNSNRRRVEGSVPRREAFRFDICDRCFERIKRECMNERKETEKNDGKKEL
jgi:hypothetical protein